ncbi:MAG TPA: phosphotransferase [Ktedonobacterales bacterium]
MQLGSDEMEVVREEATAALAAWNVGPGEWQVTGAVRGSLSGGLRPVVEIDGWRYVLRRESLGLSEDDVSFRHDFMRHLRAEGLPVPEVRVRPSGGTYALVTGDIYELQEYRAGAAYDASGPEATERIEAAAATLGAVHQASAVFVAPPHRWPEERLPVPMAETYVEMVRQAAERDDVTQAVAAAATRVAEDALERVAAAARALDVVPGPPELHIHGDFQPHNLAFNAAELAAIYDFDAARWARRLDELAYALLCFSGLRDTGQGQVALLADDGLDITRAHAFLLAYGQVAPPAEEEAGLLGDAITLAFPVLVANGIAEDLVFADDFGGAPAEQEILPRLEWADAFWLWLDRYRDVLAEAWESAG